MVIEEVSPSRTELRLGFTQVFTQTEQTELFEFVQPSVPRILASGLVGSTVGVGEGDVITQTETGLVQVQEFIDMVVEQLQNENPNLFAELSSLQPDGPDNLNLTIEFMSAAIYDEFVSLLELTKNTKQFDRLQENELLILIEKAVDNAFVNNNINLFTQNTVQYV
jgi:hypothetical protein